MGLCNTTTGPSTRSQYLPIITLAPHRQPIFAGINEGKQKLITGFKSQLFERKKAMRALYALSLISTLAASPTLAVEFPIASFVSRILNRPGLIGGSNS